MCIRGLGPRHGPTEFNYNKHTTITHKYKNDLVKRHELKWKIPRQKPTKFNYHKPINQSIKSIKSNQINSNTTLKRHTTITHKYKNVTRKTP